MLQPTSSAETATINQQWIFGKSGLRVPSSAEIAEVIKVIEKTSSLIRISGKAQKQSQIRKVEIGNP